jgi:hypothetical protein
MRTLYLIPLALGTVTLSACSDGSAPTPASSASAHAKAPIVRHFVATPSSGRGVDNAPKGPSVGDQFFERGVLKSTDGSSAGTYQLVTQLVAGTAKDGYEHQSISVQLSDGEILTLADMHAQDHYVVPVIGGSGAYAGATGTLSARAAGHHRELLTLTITG